RGRGAERNGAQWSQHGRSGAWRSERKCPGELEIADIAGIDLIEAAKAGIGVILRRHRPLLVVRHEILDAALDLSLSGAEHDHQQRRRTGDPHADHIIETRHELASRLVRSKGGRLRSPSPSPADRKSTRL